MFLFQIFALGAMVGISVLLSGFFGQLHLQLQVPHFQVYQWGNAVLKTSQLKHYTDGHQNKGDSILQHGSTFADHLSLSATHASSHGDIISQERIT